MSSDRRWLRLYRVKDWIHFLPLPLAGWMAAPRPSLIALAGGVCGWACALAYASALNQAFDDRLDRSRPDKNPVGISMRRRTALLGALPPLVGALLFEVLLAPGGLWPAVIQLVAATLYSAPPRVKRVPALGTAWNLLVGLPGLFFVRLPVAPTALTRVLFGLFALTLLVSQLIHEAEDVEDDGPGGVRTMAAVAGVRAALALACGLLVLLPFAGSLLDRGGASRLGLTAASAVFALGWLVALGRRLWRADLAALRPTRIRYRYSALLFGAVVFALTATGR